MTMRNLDICLLVSDYRLQYKDIANQMGISRVWLSTLMRYDLEPQDRKRILKAIDELIAKKKEEEGGEEANAQNQNIPL